MERGDWIRKDDNLRCVHAAPLRERQMTRSTNPWTESCSASKKASTPGSPTPQRGRGCGSLHFRHLKLGCSGLGAAEHKCDRVDEAARIGRGVIAIGRKHGGLERNEVAIGEIE